jgi:hypothetical protein
MSEVLEQESLSASIMRRPSLFLDDLHADIGSQTANVVLHPSQPADPALVALSEGPCPPRFADDRVYPGRDPHGRGAKDADGPAFMDPDGEECGGLVVVVRGFGLFLGSPVR